MANRTSLGHIVQYRYLDQISRGWMDSPETVTHSQAIELAKKYAEQESYRPPEMISREWRVVERTRIVEDKVVWPAHPPSIHVQVYYYVEYRYTHPIVGQSAPSGVWPWQALGDPFLQEKDARGLKDQCIIWNREDPKEAPKEWRVARVTTTREHEVLP